MGASKSKVAVERILESSASILNETIMKNTSTISQTQGIKIRNVKGDVNISNINWKQFAQINTKALASSAVSNEVAQQLQEKFKTEAAAVSESLSLSVNQSQNVSKLSQKLAIEVANKFSQECSQQTNQSQSFDIEGVGGNVNIHAINWEQYASQTLECTLNSAANSSTVTEIENEIDVGAKAEGKGLMSGPLIFILVIILVIGAVLYGGMQMTGGTLQEVIKNKWVWIAIMSIVGLYLVGGLFTGCCWPFATKEENCCDRGNGCGYNWPQYHEEFFVKQKEKCCGQQPYKVPKPMMEKCCGLYPYRDEPGNVLPNW